MSNYQRFMKPLMWSVALLLSIFMAACGHGGGGPSTDKAITAYSLNGVDGTINETAKTIAVTLPFGTDVTSLVATFRKTGPVVTIGTTPQFSGVSSNDFTNPVTYTVAAHDLSLTTYTVTVTVASSSAKALTAFSLSGVAGTIDETGKTIAVIVPFGTNVSTLVATFSTTGASVKIGATTQASATTANNFTAPVAYIVTAADSSTATYTVTVTVAANSAKALTAYSLNGVSGTINEAGKTIAVTMPSGTNVNTLVATFTSTGTTVQVGATTQVSTSTANNFTAPVAYLVTAADSSAVTYTVTVTVAPSSAKAITAFSLDGVTGTINEGAKTIAVTMPSGTSVSALVATFTATGASVKIGATTQTTAITANDFTSPVAYIVTAADSSTATYTVTVTVTLAAVGLPAVALGTAGNYAIFSNTAISNATVPAAITGDMAVGPGVTSTAVTGFSLNLVAAAPSSTSAQVTGAIYAFDYAAPTPTAVTTASNDMGLAYDDAAGRITPDFLNLNGGELSGQNLAPGLYRWVSDVTLNSGAVTLTGTATDVWIFQITGTLSTAAGTNVILSGGALPKNIFWLIEGSAVTIGATAHFEGVVLANAAINFGNQSTINGRLLAKTAVSLNQSTVVAPAP